MSRTATHAFPLALVPVAALAVAGCTSAAPTVSSRPAPRPTTAEPAAAPAPPVDAGPTAEETVTWVLTTLEAGGTLTTADVEARFAPAFLATVPAAKVVEIFAMLGQQLPPAKVRDRKDEPPLTSQVLLETASGGVRMVVGMSATEPRKIETLLFQPATAELPPRSYSEAVGQLTRAGARSQLFVAELDKGKCVPRQNHNTTDRLAIGSTFKLWVLVALDEKLARSRGKLGWDTPLAVRDQAKSLPSGEMQDQPAGTEHPLREFAVKMISISDNTATDHLIDYVGRDAVEKALRLAHHGKPAANTPFFRTRELFALKLATTPEELDAYLAARPAKRRKLLDQLRTRPIDVDAAVASWKTPRHLELEWFADGRDLCNVMATLATRGKLDPSSELLQILAHNPGVPVDTTQWSYVGFKGGSEPGVINLTFLLRRSDQRWFVVGLTVNDADKPVDEALVVNAATGTLQVLGGEAAGPAAD